MAYIKLESEYIDAKNLRPFEPRVNEILNSRIEIDVVISGVSIHLEFARTPSSYHKEPTKCSVCYDWTGPRVDYPGVKNMTDLIRLVWFLTDGDIEASEPLPQKWVSRFINPIREI